MDKDKYQCLVVRRKSLRDKIKDTHKEIDVLQAELNKVEGNLKEAD